MKRLINPAKALRTLRKTPTILTALLKDLTPEQATSWRDPSGDPASAWSILYIVCHLRDMEALYTGRVEDLLAKPNPVFRTTSNEELVRLNDYDRQPFREALDEYLRRRQRLIALLETVTEAQWLLTGTHPEQGPAMLLDVAINCGLHDVDHMEQIVGCIGG